MRFRMTGRMHDGTMYAIEITLAYREQPYLCL